MSQATMAIMGKKLLNEGETNFPKEKQTIINYQQIHNHDNEPPVIIVKEKSNSLKTYHTSNFKIA